MNTNTFYKRLQALTKKRQIENSLFVRALDASELSNP